MIERPAVRRSVALVFSQLWLLTLILPTVTIGNDQGRGWFILLFGWMGILMMQPGWLANPLMIAALIMAGRVDSPKRFWSVGIGVSMILCAVSALSWVEVSVGGNYGKIGEYLIGYWLWIALIVLVGTWTMLRPFCITRIEGAS